MSNAYMSEGLIYGSERHSIRAGISEARNGNIAKRCVQEGETQDNTGSTGSESETCTGLKGTRYARLLYYEQ